MLTAMSSSCTSMRCFSLMNDTYNMKASSYLRTKNRFGKRGSSATNGTIYICLALILEKISFQGASPLKLHVKGKL